MFTATDTLIFFFVHYHRNDEVIKHKPEGLDVEVELPLEFLTTAKERK